MKYLIALGIMYFGTFFGLPTRPESIVAKFYCEVVKDGDTIIIRAGKQRLVVRLLYIDAPELAQEGGQIAKMILAERVEGKWVTLRLQGKGFYGRHLGEVYSRGKSVNLELIQRGYATIYQFTKFNSSRQRWSYLVSQFRAHNQRIGVWKNRRGLSPAYFRKLKKKTLVGSH